jgi:heat shock protein HslJ
MTSIISACSFSTLNGDQGLEGTSWQLISFNSSSLLPGTSMTASFEEGEIRGSGGCNSYFGSYSASGSNLEIKELAWTEMACLDPEGIMQQEQVLMSLLSTAETYSMEGSTLQINTAAGEHLRFELMEKD